MRRFIIKNKVFLMGIILIFVYFAINLILINDYGVTWDFSYHLNAGLWHFKLPQTSPNFVMFASNPLPDILPTLFYLVLYGKMHLLAFDNAYNLFSIMIGSLGAGILFWFVSDLFNFPTGLTSALVLMFLPRYFGHLHNNMKDIPQAVFFTASLWLFYRYFKFQRRQHLFFGSFALSLLFLTKINGIFVPVIIFVWLLAIFRQYSFKYRLLKLMNFLSLSVLFFLVGWVLLWDKPLFWFTEQLKTYTTSTTNVPVLYFGNIYYSGNNVPWHYPIGLLLVTTPLPILFTFFIGLIVIFYKILQSDKSSWLIFLWLIVPLLRYFKPQMIVVDDIRHFMETIFPFSVISGLGLVSLLLYIGSIVDIKLKKLVPLAIGTILIIYLVRQNFLFHPYQASYYNEFFVPQVRDYATFDTDFWGYSYKKAMMWLNKYAPTGSKIIVAMIPDIAQFYLRPDLAVTLNKENLTYAASDVYSGSDYTVIMNRRSFFQWYNIYPYINNRSPVYTVYIDNLPLAYIFKNR